MQLEITIYVYLSQPETSFGVVAPHQTGVGIESPIVETNPLTSVSTSNSSVLVHRGSGVFQSHHSAVPKNRQLHRIAMVLLRLSPEAPQKVSPDRLLKS